MSDNESLSKRISGVMESISLKVFPVGGLDDIERGILHVRQLGIVEKAVKLAFGGLVVAAALAMSPAVMAQGVGYDAGVYGQSQGQVMQAGTAVRMDVLDVRPVKIEVAAQARQGGSNAMGYAVMAASGGVGAVIGQNLGGNNQSVRQLGAILGGLLGAVGGNMANEAMNAPTAPKLIDGTEITLVNPITNELSTLTQAGSQPFSPGDHVLVTTVGGNTRVVADRGHSVEKTTAQAPGRNLSSGRSMEDVKSGFQQGMMHAGAMVGLQLDQRQVAELLDKGAPQQGSFSGTVKAIDDVGGVLYLSTGRGAGVVLPIDALSRVPGVDEKMTVRFMEGKGLVTGVQHDHGKGVGRG